MSIKLWGNKFVAIDTETSGLIPEVHEITQLAAVALTSDFEPVTDYPKFNIYIQPVCPETIQAKALTKSHLSLEFLMVNGVDNTTALRLWNDWLQGLNAKKVVPVAYNWAFDRDFLINFMGRQSYENTFHPRVRDGMSYLSYVSDRLETFEYSTGFTTFGLEKCCEILGVTNLRAHDALHDCLATAECVRQLLRIAFPAA